MAYSRAMHRALKKHRKILATYRWHMSPQEIADFMGMMENSDTVFINGIEYKVTPFTYRGEFPIL